MLMLEEIRVGLSVCFEVVGWVVDCWLAGRSFCTENRRNHYLRCPGMPAKPVPVGRALFLGVGEG